MTKIGWKNTKRYFFSVPNQKRIHERIRERKTEKNGRPGTEKIRRDRTDHQRWHATNFTIRKYQPAYRI